MNYKTRQPFPHAAYVEGQRNFTYFDRSLTSGLTDEIISSPGDFLYIDQASTGVVSIELNMRQGGTLAPILLAAGGSIECDFASIKINATAQLNKTVRIVVGNGARIKGGANVNASSMSVSMLDGNKARTSADRAFMGVAGAAASVGNYTHAQLFNPSNSGRTVFVEKVQIKATGIAASFNYGTYSTQLANLNGYAPSKKVGGNASIAQLRYENNPGGLITASYGLLTVGASEDRLWANIEPVQLNPGTGIVLMNQATNAATYCLFEFFEE